MMMWGLWPLSFLKMNNCITSLSMLPSTPSELFWNHKSTTFSFLYGKINFTHVIYNNIIAHWRWSMCLIWFRTGISSRESMWLLWQQIFCLTFSLTLYHSATAHLKNNYRLFWVIHPHRRKRKCLSNMFSGKRSC